MTKVIRASVIIASVTIMASVTYGKCNLRQRYYGKSIMANEIEPVRPMILTIYPKGLSKGCNLIRKINQYFANYLF